MKAKKKNEFEISYNNSLKYKAKLPFVSIKNPLNLEKLRTIKILDSSDQVVYQTDYKYIENIKEEIIPFKYMVTGSQKFNQLLFVSPNNTIKIHYEMNEIWNGKYVIEINNNKYYCYSIEHGYVRHFPIYYGETQIGEALKSNIVLDGNDEYYCYLKDEYKEISDGIVVLLLYLDRNEYSSSYLINKSYTLNKNYSYSKTNQYFDKDWVKNNFGNEFFEKVDKDVALVKEKLKHPLKSSKEQLSNMDKKNKNLLLFILIAPWAMILAGGIFALVVILLSK